MIYLVKESSVQILHRANMAAFSHKTLYVQLVQRCRSDLLGWSVSNFLCVWCIHMEFFIHSCMLTFTYMYIYESIFQWKALN